MSKHSPLASPRATIATLQDYGLYTKKRLGQHFLINDGVVGKIMALAAPAKGDTLLEVGPGIGTLTLALLGTGQPTIAVEKDPALLPALRANTASVADATRAAEGERAGRTTDAASGARAGDAACCQRFALLHQDALDLDALIPQLPAGPLMLVANLPYQVAATVVLAYFERLPQLRAATVMVQREVAERMMAHPGTKAYGAYTVKLALLARATGSFAVSRSSFLPPPRVDSTVIRLDRREEGAGAADSAGAEAGAKVKAPGYVVATDAGAGYATVAALVDAAFAMRRKTLLNNLKAAWPDRPPEALSRALADIGADDAVRAEALDPLSFVRLAALLLAESDE